MPVPQTALEDLTTEEDEVETDEFAYDITSYGADYPVDGLVKRVNEGAIEIPPFQRHFVWTKSQASKFVESLLLGLPVPGVFLAKQSDSGALLVVDGQQRLTTLKRFYSGTWDEEQTFRLKGVHARFQDKTYDELGLEDKRRLDDAIVHATVVKQNSPDDNTSSIYHIFERLNTGGTLLLPQEIRSCIYHGPFNDLLHELAQNEDWVELVGVQSKRMKDRELILRFLTLRHAAEKYSAPMKSALNNFMDRNRHLQLVSADRIRSEFNTTTSTIRRAVGNRAFKPDRAVNAAVMDAVMVGVAARLASGAVLSDEGLAQAHRRLMANSEFQSSFQKSTANEKQVETRLRLSREAFAQA